MSGALEMGFISETFCSANVFVRLAHHRLGHHFLPPIATFPVTEAQRGTRLIFATHRLTAQTDWGKAMFVDETSVWLCNDHRWLWRK
jgi:hypothetical protein